MVVGILALFLVLAVATHLDAQPRGRNQSGGSANKSDEFTIMRELKARGLQDMQIAEELRKQGSVFGEILVTMLGRLSAGERRTQVVSQQPAAPATGQTGSTVGELTCTKLTVVNNQGQPIFVIKDHSNGGHALLYGSDGDTRMDMVVSQYGGALVNLTEAAGWQGELS